MSKIRIMLDPGHDKAKYNQSPVVPEYWEGARMWRLYGFLRTALEAKGFEVGCTKRKCDQTVDVVTRGRKARGYNAFISLHSNACGDSSVDRPVGIYFVDDDCGKIDGQSKVLAKLLSQTVADVMGTRNKASQYNQCSSRDRDGDGRKNDDYYGMLYGAHQVGVTGIILEHSFHTNKNAARWLMSDANLRKLAEAEAKALATYFKVEPQKPIITTPTKEEFEVKVPVLKKGDTGEAVKAFQKHLLGHGYKMTNKGKTYDADGSFGQATENALKAYQKDHGLEVDGSRGPATFASMNGL